MKRCRWKLVMMIGLVVLLAVAFGGCGGPSETGEEPPAAVLDAGEAGNEAPEPSDAPTASLPETGQKPAGDETPPSEDAPQDGSNPVVEAPVLQPLDGADSPPAELDRYQTEPIPEGKPAPVEPQEAEATDVALTCTMSIRCDTILDNMDKLDPDKAELIPADGVILPVVEVTFYEGESVFNVLQREMKRNKMHMEYVSTPVYNSSYIEGIYNLYEFDCGDLSGWMYCVNDWFPNYGPSRYQLQAGDVVEWVYSCDLGRDVGGEYSAGQQR